MELFNQSMLTLFERDLDRLGDEIGKYQEETELWIVEKEIANSAGNLCLHLIGNLNHYIGKNLGNTTYVRDRHGEFNNKNIARDVVLQYIRETKEMVRNIIPSLSKDNLKQEYIDKVFGHPMSTQYFLLHLYGHFNYHLGQINYHRRLLTNSNTPNV